jgi:hypothetical protein
MNTAKTVLGLAVLLFVSGCGGDLIEVTGKLTHRGQPVPSTRVTFLPEDGSRKSSAVTNDDGTFRLKYSRTQLGVMRGPHTVCLSYVVSNDEDLGKKPPKVSRELKAVIGRYADPKKSSLHVEVIKNGQVVDLDLQ